MSQFNFLCVRVQKYMKFVELSVLLSPKLEWAWASNVPQTRNYNETQIKANAGGERKTIKSETHRWIVKIEAYASEWASDRTQSWYTATVGPLSVWLQLFSIRNPFGYFFASACDIFISSIAYTGRWTSFKLCGIHFKWTISFLWACMHQSLCMRFCLVWLATMRVTRTDCFNNFLVFILFFSLFYRNISGAENRMPRGCSARTCIHSHIQ